MTGLRVRRAALALGCALALTGGTAHAATVGGFEGGDGDQAATCAADARDWQCLTGSEILGAVDASGSADDIFTTGKEETPDGWALGTGSVPQKADFQAVWTNVTGAPGGHSYLNLAFKRVAGNGDTYLGVELNQSRTTFRNSMGATVPCRHDGDVLVAYTAGSSPSVTLYRWDGTTGPAACPDGGDGHWVTPVATTGALAAVNSGSITNYLNTAQLGSAFANETFGEAALDLTAVADAVQYPSTACEYFRSMTVKSRTSSGINSSLADLVRARNVVARSCETPDPGTGGGGGGSTPPADTTAPNPPAFAGVIDGAKSCSGRVVLSGTAEPGSSVTVYEGTAALGDFTTADPATGAWSIQVSGLAVGTHTFTADATDAAGNTSTFATPATVTVATCPAGEYGTPGVDPIQTGDGTNLPPADTTAPDAPAFTAAASCGKVDLTGTAEPASIVTVYDGATVAGTAVADAAGAWSLAVTGVAAGDHAYRAKATDGSGNGSMLSGTVAVSVASCPGEGSGTGGDTPGGGGTPGGGDVAPGAPAIPTGPAPDPMGGAASSGTDVPGFELVSKPSTAPGCQLKPFRAYVRRKGVKKVVFKVDGKRVFVDRKADAKGQFVALIKTAKLTAGNHVVTGTIVFKAKGKKAKTVKLRFRKCDQCQSRRSFKVHPRGLHKGERAVSAKIYLNGKLYKSVKGGKKLGARIVLKGMSKGIQKVKIVAKTNQGRTLVDKRKFKTCMKKGAKA